MHCGFQSCNLKTPLPCALTHCEPCPPPNPPLPSPPPPSPRSCNVAQDPRSEPCAPTEIPVHIDARLPPLYPERSAVLKYLAAPGGSLVAGPVVPEHHGMLLQWGGAKGSLSRPVMEPEQVRGRPLGP